MLWGVSGSGEREAFPGREQQPPSHWLPAGLQPEAGRSLDHS